MVARRRVVFAVAVKDVDVKVVMLDAGKSGIVVTADGVVAPAVSAVEKENDFVSLFSTGPADNGGVAVIVLGNRNSCMAAAAGETGCAVRGVSGKDVEGYGVCAPCWF